MADFKARWLSVGRHHPLRLALLLIAMAISMTFVDWILLGAEKCRAAPSAKTGGLGGKCSKKYLKGCGNAGLSESS